MFSPTTRVSYDRPTDDLSDATLTTALSFSCTKTKKKLKQNYWKSLNFPFCAGSTANKYTTHTQALFLCYIFIVFYVYLFKILLWNLFFSLRFTFKTSSRNLFFGTLTLTLFSVPCRSFFVCLLLSSSQTKNIKYFCMHFE